MKALTVSKTARFSWVLAVGLIGSAVCAEWLSTYFMTVLSRFYEAIITENQSLFISELRFACILSFSLAVLKSLKKYCAQSCSLEWRTSKINEIQMYYFDSYGTAMKSALSSLDNVDQRITQDIENLSVLYADIAEKIAVVPFIIIYYSIYLIRLLGWLVVAIAFSYFLVGTLFGSILMNRLVSVVYHQEVMEGNFRFFHSGVRVHHWIIVLLRGLTKEKAAGNILFDKVVANKKKFINLSVPVDLFSSWFDYAGSIGK